MTTTELLKNLCYKDPRSPYFAADEEESPPKPRIDCFCDNCFYGRDRLAVEVLMYRELLEELANLAALFPTELSKDHYAVRAAQEKLCKLHLLHPEKED